MPSPSSPSPRSKQLATSHVCGCSLLYGTGSSMLAPMEQVASKQPRYLGDHVLQLPTPCPTTAPSAQQSSRQNTCGLPYCHMPYCHMPYCRTATCRTAVLPHATPLGRHTQAETRALRPQHQHIHSTTHAFAFWIHRLLAASSRVPQLLHSTGHLLQHFIDTQHTPAVRKPEHRSLNVVWVPGLLFCLIRECDMEEGASVMYKKVWLRTK